MGFYWDGTLTQVGLTFITQYCYPYYEMLVIGIGWVFVVVVFALGQVSSAGGTWLGMLVTLVVGLAPLAVVVYIALAASRRRRMRRASAVDPDRGGHAPGDAVAPERKES
ncbi:MAG TPA: hypothetical protein VI032_16070 [Burkholderiaceae bacterium]